MFSDLNMPIFQPKNRAEFKPSDLAAVDEFSPHFYRAHYQDLAHLTDTGLREHYEQFGRNEGRQSSPFAAREGLIEMAASCESVLEIGPFCNPVMRGDNVRYLDVLDAEGLKARARAIGLTEDNCPSEIHYVGDLAGVSEKFDAVLSCHSIEHQPNLIGHLNSVAEILNENGLYLVIVPDKRFCFDYSISESTLADVLDAHINNVTQHSVKSIVEHRALTTHNDVIRHWQGDHGRLDEADVIARARAALEEFKESLGGYIDVHAWQFTPDGFRSMIKMLSDMNVIRFNAHKIYDTISGRNEFCAILQVSD